MVQFFTNLSSRQRRWSGALCLLGAIVLLVADDFFFKERPTPAMFLVYWLTCLLLTLLAAISALAEMRVLRQQSRDLQRGIFEETLRKIEHDRQTRGPEKPPSDA